MRQAITILSLVALLAAPAASGMGCRGCCDEPVSGTDDRGRDGVCACCTERAKPEDSGACEPVCLCDHHTQQQAPPRTGEVSSVEPESLAGAVGDQLESPSIATTCNGVNRTPPRVFTPLRV